MAGQANEVVCYVNVCVTNTRYRFYIHIDPGFDCVCMSEFCNQGCHLAVSMATLFIRALFTFL